MTEQATDLQAAEEQAAPETEIVAAEAGPTEMVEYGGFWRRLGAYIIDTILVSIVSVVLVFAYAFVHAMAAEGEEVSEEVVGVVAQLIFFLVGWLYWAIMESSPEQATLGKMAVGLKVIDMEGRRIGFWRATGRYFGKIISSLFLYAGFIMVAFTAKKQGMHDIMASCVVIIRPRDQEAQAA